MQVSEQAPLQGYLTLDDAVSMSGYKPTYLMQLAREGHIERIEEQQGIFRFSARDLRNYIRPRGYLTVEEAVQETGFDKPYLRKLAREKRVRSVKKHRQVFLFARDMAKLKVPEGYLRPEEAARPTRIDQDEERERGHTCETEKPDIASVLAPE